MSDPTVPVQCDDCGNRLAHCECDDPFRTPLTAPVKTLYSEHTQSYHVLTSPEPCGPLPAPAPDLPTVTESMTTMKAAYQKRVSLIAQLFLAQSRLTRDQEELEVNRNVILTRTDPKELGSNEAARNAALAQRLAPLMAKVSLGQKAVESLKCECEIARLECRLCDQTLEHIGVATASLMHENYEE